MGRAKAAVPRGGGILTARLHRRRCPRTAIGSGTHHRGGDHRAPLKSFSGASSAGSHIHLKLPPAAWDLNSRSAVFIIFWVRSCFSVTSNPTVFNSAPIAYSSEESD